MSRATGSISWYRTLRRQIAVLRAYRKYLLQVGIPFSQHGTDARPQLALARLAAQLFEVKFDPDLTGERQARLAELEAAFRAGLDAVANLDETALRRLPAPVGHAAHQLLPARAGRRALQPYLSLKINPAAVPEMPLLLPAYEIFVYAPRTEGVHLRGGKVARGGSAGRTGARTSAPRCSA